MELRPSRRGVLAGVAATALTVVLPTGAEAAARDADRAPAVEGRLRALEQRHAARLGVFAYDTGTGRSVRYRAGELFPICSTVKTIAVAAVLRDLDRDGRFLARRIHYTAEYVADSGYAPITGAADNVARGMTVAELCAAAIEYSDNGAGNLLVRELGGPRAVTRFCRSVGDRVTRLDRWEPALNSAEPWRVTDTTSPHAVARTYARLALGDVLTPRKRELLTGWLLANTTSAHRFRAGLPKGWTVADKTGTGDYGTTNDVGLTWPPGRRPIVLSVLSTKHDPTSPTDEPLVAEAAAAVAAALA